MEHKLRDCPFCGGAAEIVETKGEFTPMNKHYAFVRCKVCQAQTMSRLPVCHLREEIIAIVTAAWNRRVSNFNERNEVPSMRDTSGIAAPVDREPQRPGSDGVHIHIHVHGVRE